MATRGRIKGVRNKRTQFMLAKTQAASAAPVLAAVENGRLTLRDSSDLIGASLNIMAECMGVFIDYARSLPKDKPEKTAERLEAYDHALHAAAMVAPYRYPKFATLKINDDTGRKAPVADNVAYDDVLADLVEHMRRTGTKPRKMIEAAETAGLLPSKPKPPPPRPPRPRPPPPPQHLTPMLPHASQGQYSFATAARVRRRAHSDGTT